jgi:DNA-directed RNA polymerase subunit RPC12/RpoP
MPITFKVFHEKMKNEEFRKSGAQRCAECGVALQETITGNRKTDKGNVCSDCYFHLLGKELDENQIFMPRTVRGT